MKTLLQITQYISKMPNSELSTVTAISDVTDEQINALNQALKTIWDYANWDFRYNKTTFDTVVDQADYAMVDGIIKENGIRITGVSNPLRYEPNHEVISPSMSSGIPYRYWVEGNEIVLNPTPSSVKTVTVKFTSKYPVKTSGGALKTEFDLDSSTDFLNIPERIEPEFIRCLGHLTNEILNADQTDEDYLEHNLRYKKAISDLQLADRGSSDNSASITY